MTTQQIPITVRLNVDSFLLHLIQQTTKESSVEILAFFNGLGKEISRIGADNRKKENQSIRKVIHDFYPNTAIPIEILVKGRAWGHLEKRTFSATVEVSFPTKIAYFNSQEIDEAMIERLILNGDDMPPFERPATKTPKMLKKLMEGVKTSTESIKKHQDDE